MILPTRSTFPKLFECVDIGRAIVEQILHETRTWQRAAQALRIARTDIELIAAAFAESEAARD